VRADAARCDKLQRVFDRVLMISGVGGLTADVTKRAEARLPGSRRVVLAGYDAPGWPMSWPTERRDRARDDRFPRQPEGRLPAHASREGVHAGISWRIEVRGRR